MENIANVRRTKTCTFKAETYNTKIWISAFAGMREEEIIMG